MRVLRFPKIAGADALAADALVLRRDLDPNERDAAQPRDVFERQRGVEVLGERRERERRVAPEVIGVAEQMLADEPAYELLDRGVRRLHGEPTLRANEDEMRSLGADHGHLRELELFADDVIGRRRATVLDLHVKLAVAVAHVELALRRASMLHEP